MLGAPSCAGGGGMMRILALVLAGGLGALCRFGMASSVQARAGTSFFPWGTASVNLLGCILFGLVWTLGEKGKVLTPESRAVILTGFMGAFTTFSTYAFETSRLLQAGQWSLAAGNVLGQNLLGLLGIWLGIWLGGAR